MKTKTPKESGALGDEMLRSIKLSIIINDCVECLGWYWFIEELNEFHDCLEKESFYITDNGFAELEKIYQNAWKIFKDFSAKLKERYGCIEDKGEDKLLKIGG